MLLVIISHLPKGGSSGQIGDMYTISWHADLINTFTTKFIFEWFTWKICLALGTIASWISQL